jgi:Protein of unknown function (DUF3558)
MTRLSAWLICAATAAMALLAGCSGTGAGSAVPPANSSIVPKERQQLSPPPVERPRDVQAYGNRPCDVFTTAQLNRFGFDLPPDRTNISPSGHKTCAWIDSGHNGELVVGIYPDWDVLERTYANKAALKFFEPMQIDGVPAVVYQFGVKSHCEVTIGLAERQGLDVSFTDLSTPYEDPCGAARAAAEVAVGNLPPLS